MSLLAGAAEADITPPFPVDLLGYVRRPLAARSAYEPLLATACALRDEADGATVVIIAADVVGLTTPMADRIRARVGELVGCDPAAVLLNSSHTHAAPWPGAIIKLGGEFDDWTETELRYWDSIPDRYASVALEALGRLAPARIATTESSRTPSRFQPRIVRPSAVRSRRFTASPRASPTPPAIRAGASRPSASRATEAYRSGIESQ